MMRRQEPGRPGFPGELWNTVSNLPFVVLGLLRLATVRDPHGRRMYTLFVAIGICSALHHACPPGWRRSSLVLDYIPIVTSLYYGVSIVPLVSAASWAKVVLALVVVLVDHLSPLYTASGNPLVPVPFGHAFWHVLAALAVDSAYADAFVHRLHAQ